ncbi:MAG: acetyl-CoA C-acetyltransferase [Thiotrichaceae bacterium]|nr:acetyl-CoA C-acetyltransferase [Thiotrichaceae bacterium]
MITLRPVYLIDGTRTPFLKACSKPSSFYAADLAVNASKALLLRQPFAPDAIDEVIFGCASPTVDEANIARIIALRLGCGDQTPAFTVHRNCASGLNAVDSACRNIAAGYSDLVLAGGVEAMSHAPLLLQETMVNWLAHWNQAKSLGQKLMMLSQLRPSHFAPVIALLRGLRDPVIGMSMGQTAEEIAYTFKINRNAMDSFAVQSHQRLKQAINEGYHSEIIPLYDHKGNVYLQDDGLREDSSTAKLAKLHAVFDQPAGHVTAGNSAQITDGAASLLLASEHAIEQYQLPVIARLHPAQWAGVKPSQMGLGPVHAIAKTLVEHQLPLKNIDYWEINEAFAAQVLACVKALDDDDYCQQEVGVKKALGLIDSSRLNIDGGGISQGHPIGATGARIVLHLATILQRKKAQRGIASLCIGGGQGGAMLIEAVNHG